MTNGSQLGEGLWAIAAGGWDGQGMARGLTPIVPAGKTDLVLATMTEQLGARALVAYHLLLASIVLGALFVAVRSRTAVRVLMASGIGVLVLAQWLVILCGTLGKLPLTGIVVPFLSSGRSSMAVFVVMVAIVSRLGSDGRMRVASTELDEVHGAARGVKYATFVLAAFAILASVLAACTGRVETSAHAIRVRLADGTLIDRRNPRLVAIAERIRRGSILDRNGVALALSDAKGRSYPLGNAMGTLLGIAPSKVLLPSWALERVHDDDLRGWSDMRDFVELLDLGDDARDAAIAKLDAAIAKRSVKLTIDSRLQTNVAQLLRAATAKRLAAAAVVIDVDTGEVLARVQVPDYDPNTPAWQAHILKHDDAYLKKLYGAYGEWPDKTGVQGMFQSGSVGKLFTALAAVREGQGEAKFDCKDSDAQGPMFTLPKWPKPIHDHEKDRVHGTPDLIEALAVSCNVYFAQLGLALGAEPLTRLRKAGVDVGYGEKFDPGAAGTRHLASTAFGQGAMVMNVMQAARLAAAIASGGKYVRCPPTMELGAKCSSTTIVDDPSALSPIVLGMRRVMTHGTGARLTVPAGVRVYGKTGTADVRGFAGEEPFGIARAQVASPHSWFVAFAEPTSVPESSGTAAGRIAVAVVIPRGGTGASAAGPLAMQVIAAAAELGYLKP
jgi:peptidoglycan glycosyltransferase